MSVAILGAVERGHSGLAAGQMGGVIGVAVLGALVGSPPSVAGVSLGSFVGASALALAGALAIAAFRDDGAEQPSSARPAGEARGEG